MIVPTTFNAGEKARQTGKVWGVSLCRGQNLSPRGKQSKDSVW